ncbi:MAG TPA: zinc-binding dehydrogenase [Bacteroidia bacterium]|nr:zinc-binding dehydrogenase [Bacteroidia bacterium]
MNTLLPEECNTKTSTIYSKTGLMQAAILEKPGKFTIKNVPVPMPKPDEIVFQVEGCGVCSSSLPLFQGRNRFDYPLMAGNPGHESWGKIVFTGSKVNTFKTGDRIAALTNNSFAVYDKVNMQNAIRLPKELNDIDFPGETLGCAMNVFRRSDIKPGHTVAVIGAGFLGALIIQLAKAAGARVLAFSKRPYSLNVAKQCGADEVIQLQGNTKTIELVKELTSGKLCDRVIEATGKQFPLDLSGELTKERGKLIIAGFHQDEIRKVNIELWNLRGLDVINAHEREPQMFLKGMREAVDAVMSGKMRTKELYTHEFDLKEINQAFDLLIQRPEGYLKCLIKMD